MRELSLPRPRSGRPVRGFCLLLHGGTQRSTDPVDRRSLSWWRMRALHSAVRPRLSAAGVPSALLRFELRGWNDPARPAPVADARWALGEVRRAFPGVPVVLLGHSMGARTALRVLDEESVAGMVGLAPWFPADDPVEQAAGRSVLAAHGSRDPITDARQTRRLLERLDGVRPAASTRFVDMGPVGHYMLARRRAWDRIAARGVLDALAPPGSAG